MLLTEIVLNNVGVFLGRHAIDLSGSTRDKPVVLFGGLNGGGKTTFLESLQLGLYGRLANTGRRGKRAYEAYLENLINQHVSLTEGAAIQVAFREFEDQAEVDYRVVRTWRQVRSKVQEQVEVYVNGTFDSQLSESWDEVVERFLPQKLCNLFFFDGEQIEALADPHQSRDILETAISGLLGLELVDQLVTDLQVVRRNKLREKPDSGYGKKFEEIDQELKELKTEKEKKETLRENAVVEQGKARNELDRANAEYEKHGGHLLDQLRDLERQKLDHKATQSHLREELRTLATGPLPLQVLDQQLRELYSQSEHEHEARTRRESLPLMQERDESVVDWLKEHSEDPKLLKKLRSYLDASRKEQMRAAQAELRIDLAPVAMSQISALQDEELQRSSTAAQELIRELEKVEQGLMETERLLVRVPEEAALTDVISRRERARVECDRLATELESLDQEITNLYETIANKQQTQAALEKEARLDGLKDQLEGRVVDTADRMSATMQTFKRRVLERHLARLEALILDSYQSLLRKGGLISGVRISPDTLELSVLGAGGHRIEPNRLSAGERQLLATSILWGLAKASGRALPVVIDTPLGRLDSSHRTNLVDNYFPNASHQVILLSTDEEIDGRYYQRLAPNVGAQYEIFFDEERGGSAIRTGYPFEEAA